MIDYQKDKINQALASIFRKTPFLGFVLKHIEIHTSKSASTAHTDGTSITIGESFLIELSEAELEFILLHELLHIILAHPARIKEKDIKRFNVACDIVVNDILIVTGYDYGNLSPILGKQYDTSGFNNTAEEIYQALPKEIRHTTSNHSYWHLLSSDFEIQKIINKAIKAGYVSDISYRYIENHISIHKQNWKSALRQYIMKVEKDYSFEKVDRRFQPIMLPNFNPNIEQLENIWILIDASGSINQTMLDDFYSELLHMTKQIPHYQFNLSFFSRFVTKPVIIKNHKDLIESTKQIQTNLGTSFDIIFQKVNAYFKSRKPRLIIIFTDGLARFPSKGYKNIDTIWVFNQHVKPAPFGKTIYIKEVSN